MNVNKIALLIGALALAPASQAKDLRIGVALANFDLNFVSILRTQMAKEMEKEKIQGQFEDAKGDIAVQVQQVENFINQGVDAIILNPVDTQGVKPMMEAAKRANIPLIFVNRKPEVELSGKMAYVGSDSLLGGRMEMEALAKKMNYKGNVAILMGALSAEEARQRTKATEDVIAKYKEMKVVEKQSAQWMRNEAVDVTSGWLLSGNKIDAIAANNDEMAIGAIMALNQSGKKDILVAGIDGTPDALQFIKNGKLALTVFQDAAGQGKGAVTMAKQVIDGKNGDKFMWIPYQVITKDNYEAFVSKNVK
ncbi:MULTISPECIES: substrate-binding domain-containing protein [Erwiniaceae]|uniref:Substrate-binding domain-containing protein n=2 Tax=Erwiniaceae TaxID=1903409 RepID=A0ACC5RMZ6_ENTAG|nr:MULTISPECIES: substrate-binding domain-containing protein [Erwiniaceae]MBK4726039.1 substrate-binding domain-containing protein [Pantoea agglomerans]MBP2153593.1 ribose transport system substrate-binding protein [Erwinia rhapontici]NKG31241.1 sugar ABC transporter substrate-binding protein [Erwinia rhapontici]NNS08894.1 substrate-binding domain-containing protein [Erwinia sp. JH02]UDQ80484.1 substrate-binding domain-containing protein [Erwinia rhapontici]